MRVPKRAFLVLLVPLFCSCNAFASYEMASGSMEPAISRGQFLISRSLSPEDAGRIDRGTIVVFHPPGDQTEVYVKRVVGVGGDTVQIESGRLLVNGEPVMEEYGRVEDHQDQADLDFGPATVPEGTVFLLGDNWRRSLDSRQLGPVSTESLVGTILFR